MLKNRSSVGHYIVDHKRFRVSIPLFWKRIYIPEEVINRLGLNLQVEDLPKKVSFSGKLLREDGSDFPCGGNIYNIVEFDKTSGISVDGRFLRYNRQCILGFDEEIIKNEKSIIRLELKHDKSSMTFYVGRIPGFTRYAKERYSKPENTNFVNIVTKKVIIEQIVTIDYRKQVGFTEVV